MLTVLVHVVSVKGNPNHRQFCLPLGFRIFRENRSVDAARAEAFEDVEDENPVPALLAHKLFAIASVRKVEMNMDSFTLLLSPDHGDGVNERVFQAIRSVITSTIKVVDEEAVLA